MARLSQKTEAFRRLVERVQDQSQTLAQQASQAATNAQAAAQQRDLAKQAQENSETPAQLARQQATAEQQRAEPATQQAEEYRQQREAELAQLQQALSQIAETRRTAMGLVMTLDSKSVRFDFDKAYVKPEYRDMLNRIAGILMTQRDIRLPSTDTRTISARRRTICNCPNAAPKPSATSWCRLELTDDHDKPKGFGKSNPRVPGDSEQARAANRRVEIGIVDSRLLTNGQLTAPN